MGYHRRKIGGKWAENRRNFAENRRFVLPGRFISVHFLRKTQFHHHWIPMAMIVVVPLRPWLVVGIICIYYIVMRKMESMAIALLARSAWRSVGKLGRDILFSSLSSCCLPSYLGNKPWPNESGHQNQKGYLVTPLACSSPRNTDAHIVVFK